MIWGAEEAIDHTAKPVKILRLSSSTADANFTVAQIIGKHEKPFGDGEYIEEAALATWFLSDLLCKGEVIRQIYQVLLSRYTVAGRAENISEDLFQ